MFKSCQWITANENGIWPRGNCHTKFVFVFIYVCAFFCVIHWFADSNSIDYLLFIVLLICFFLLVHFNHSNFATYYLFLASFTCLNSQHFQSKTYCFSFHSLLRLILTFFLPFLFSLLFLLLFSISFSMRFHIFLLFLSANQNTFQSHLNYWLHITGSHILLINTNQSTNQWTNYQIRTELHSFNRMHQQQQKTKQTNRIQIGQWMILHIHTQTYSITYSHIKIKTKNTRKRIRLVQNFYSFYAIRTL